MTIEEFCDLHDACDEGRKWALENCTSMNDAWEKLRPDWLIWVATRPRVLSEKDLRRFAVHCARSVQHLLTNDRSRNAIDVAERHIKGMATDEELHAAGDAALAAWSAAWGAGDAALAASGAAVAAARAASAAAWSAAWGVSDAAWAASEAVWAASGNAMADQAKFIRESTTPSFARIEEAGNE